MINYNLVQNVTQIVRYIFLIIISLGNMLFFSSKIKVDAANVMTTYKMYHKNNYWRNVKNLIVTLKLSVLYKLMKTN